MDSLEMILNAIDLNKCWFPGVNIAGLQSSNLRGLADNGISLPESDRRQRCLFSEEIREMCHLFKAQAIPGFGDGPVGLFEG
ncbi:hypothetical protein [Chitinophaga sancti]|uniref:hypothetical protein n=1 Tax=Chitinophaga sancti TaxID=1004 RepID=UPI003F79F13E